MCVDSLIINNLVCKTDHEKEILSDLLPRTFKSPLGRKEGLVSYSIFTEKKNIESRCLFYLQNPNQSKKDAQSYKLSVKFKTEQNSPREAFLLLLELFRLESVENSIFYGRVTLLAQLLEIGILATDIVVTSFLNYIIPHADTVDCRGEMHPNGTGCSSGGNANRCGDCGKYC